MAQLPRYTALGSGPAVLLLHDADGGHLTFAPQVETLASLGWCAIAWDMPGYGHSAPIEPMTFKGLAHSCLALMEALRTGPVTLVGHGLGAMVALEVALREPASVQRLVLCAGGPVLDAAAQQAWVEPRLRAVESGDSMAQVAAELAPQYIGERALPEGVRLIEHALAQVYRGTWARAVRLLPTFDRSAQALAQLHQPTLVVGGAQDPCTPPEALQALAHVLPDARYREIAGAGHWPQLEAPEDFEGALLDFLAQQRTLH